MVQFYGCDEASRHDAHPDSNEMKLCDNGCACVHQHRRCRCGLLRLYYAYEHLLLW